MTHERRRSPRYSLQAPVTWTQESEIVDLSAGGCSVAASLVPATGQNIEFTTTLDASEITLAGTVVHARTGVGFGLAFGELSEEARAVIRRVLERVARMPP